MGRQRAPAAPALETPMRGRSCRNAHARPSPAPRARRRSTAECRETAMPTATPTMRPRAAASDPWGLRALKPAFAANDATLFGETALRRQAQSGTFYRNGSSDPRHSHPPTIDRHNSPHRLYQAERPCALEKAVGGAQRAGCREGENEPGAALFQRIE